ncbi:PIR Superfamily Protein [Plasmodium ovale curtisi]|uniref:PIR Superfamily Protein n=1 Tax=Plasmodium ovale curtisi TaxID=864141 RepID=A0A1A8VW36_PLAOA|nr:PIR Superfamily Protein [Plasmodium ovale curtisi]SBT02764.1 PIR Superfamily Protein [Plasmodium ovale curtisi]
MKDLYNYFKDYNHIKTNINSSQGIKRKNYYKYITYIRGLYELRRKECCVDNLYWYDCRGYFRCEDSYDPSSLIFTLIRLFQETFRKT